MYNCDDSMRTTSKRVEMQDVLDALLDAIANLPQRKDSRADPIFEPHFKLVSVVHRLVLSGRLSVSRIPLELHQLPTDDSLAHRSEQNTYCLSMVRQSGPARRHRGVETLHAGGNQEVQDCR